MDRNRRTALKSLAAVPLVWSMPAASVTVSGGPINLAGIGSCGGRIVRRLAAKGRCLTAGDSIAVDDTGSTGVARPLEALGSIRDPRECRPLIVVAGAGGPAAGERAWLCATEWSDARGGIVVPVLVLGFGWEGNSRARGLALAERFAERFRTVSLIDNEVIGEQYLADGEEWRLLDLYDRINVHAVARIEHVISERRVM